METGDLRQESGVWKLEPGWLRFETEELWLESGELRQKTGDFIVFSIKKFIFDTGIIVASNTNIRVRLELIFSLEWTPCHTTCLEPPPGGHSHHKC